jgi:hypothetical protein
VHCVDGGKVVVSMAVVVRVMVVLSVVVFSVDVNVDRSVLLVEVVAADCVVVADGSAVVPRVEVDPLG